MTPNQADLTRKSHGEFKSFPIPEERPLDDLDLQALLDGADVVQASIDSAREMVFGFTKQGMVWLSALAGGLLAERADRARLVSQRTLTSILVGVAVVQWRSRPAGALTAEELDAFKAKVAAWFNRQNLIRTHYVPCTMSAWDMPPFSIGPVRFYPLRDFPVDAIGLEPVEVWPSPDGQPSGRAQAYLTNGIFQLARMRNAGTIAEIEVPGREPKQSTLTADIAVDVALGAFQLLMPPGLFNRASRATARSAPVWWATLSRGDGLVEPSTHNDEPGRVVAPGGVATLLAGGALALASLGRRLEAYLAGSGPLPMLDEAWCNAIYWFHEALAEPLETVAIAKFETAIEVLFRSESSSGSKKRLLLGMEAFLGLGRSASIGNSGVTADQFAASIVTARSRVLHGTWPTLHTELPDGKGTRVTQADGETLARQLLLGFSLALDDYAASGNADDAVEPFLEWQRSRFPHDAACAAADQASGPAQP